MEEVGANERKQMLDQELARFLTLLRNRPEVERVIVFGSYITGEMHAWSDLDLVIIQRTNDSFLQRSHRMRDLLQPTVGTDLFVYTPNEFAYLIRERAFVRDEIVNKGQLVYERS